MNTAKLPKLPSEWPVLLLALPAFVAIWGGWVGLGELTGFGPVNLLPGIGTGWTINTAITLPIGVEAYAAYALRVWLNKDVDRSDTARRFAMWSAIGALVLGALGQVAYHLMTAWGVKVAPWQITTFVSCLPVVVLGCGAALAHLCTRTPNTAQEASADPLPAPAEPELPLRPTSPKGGEENAVPAVQEIPDPAAGTAPQEASSPLPEEASQEVRGGLRLVPSKRLPTRTQTASRKASRKTSCSDEQVLAAIASYEQDERRLPTANWLKTNLQGVGAGRVKDLLEKYTDKQEALA